MFLIRESFEEDVDQILEVAHHLDSVNLPADRGHIERILSRSSASFAETIPIAEREFLFVLEDLAERRVIGTSMIHAQHGTRRSPHVFLQVLKEERYSESLDRYLVHQCLRLAYNYDGPSEIGGLILLPEYRRHPESLGKLLSYTRFLFIAMHRILFRDQVISELMPPLEPDGTSRLWNHFGRNFTGLTYSEADLLSKDNKEFIRALFPHSLIYTSLFPDDVQQVIGVVGPETRGVEKMLRRIGFEYAQQIDPFDGGPHFIAETDRVTLVRDSRPVELAVSRSDGPERWAIVAVESPPGTQRPRLRAAGARVSGWTGSAGALLGVSAEFMDRVAAGTQGERVWAVAP
ncbi:MAG TPA: arginine N-succinyltransferase [Kofleriaceae bacterium]|nr:arginine N-succinyltransferase [Kofleriaceae bacterium]